MFSNLEIPLASPLKRGTLTGFSRLFKAGALVRSWGDLLRNTQVNIEFADTS
jgi:hypothetical protein